jgi:hypothetical protein
MAHVGFENQQISCIYFEKFVECLALRALALAHFSMDVPSTCSWRSVNVTPKN